MSGETGEPTRRCDGRRALAGPAMVLLRVNGETGECSGLDFVYDLSERARSGVDMGDTSS